MRVSELYTLMVWSFKHSTEATTPYKNGSSELFDCMHTVIMYIYIALLLIHLVS